eukprot:GHVS01015729.1.p1 GENE.GHVS01015729.1~~GHVS01015729.1.p1  ORF type:complete len:317 (+),score=57.78 GHVS01015729.1:56-952(+)
MAATIGWIGCGVMGASMAMQLHTKGHSLIVYSRTASKCLPLQSQGATVAESVASVARQCDIVFVMVGYPAELHSVVVELAPAMQRGGVIVDMSTNKPTLTQQLHEYLLSGFGIQLVDAPVSGGDVGARNGTLSIMCGGDEATVMSRLRPLFNCMGQAVKYVGSTGMGQHTKLANQIVGAANLIGVVEGLLYAHKAGLNVKDTVAVISQGASYSWAIANYAPRILKGDLEPGFYVKHFIKDLEIALDESRRMHLALPGLATIHQLYVALQAQGHGEKGVHALVLALEAMNKTKLPTNDG